MVALVFVASALLGFAAQEQDHGYPKGALGHEALLASDYATAEAQLRHDRRIAKNDPARLINLGYVMAKTGRTGEAARLFERALEAKEVDFLLADGRVMRSRDAARRALRSINAADRSGN